MAKALASWRHGRGCPAQARRRWVEGGGGGEDDGDNGATAAVAMWGVHDKDNGEEGAALSVDDDDEANEPSPRAGTDANGDLADNVGICVCRLHPPNDRHLCLSPTCRQCRADRSATFC